MPDTKDNVPVASPLEDEHSSDDELVPSAPPDENLSDAESVRSNVASLRDEPLPSYVDAAPNAAGTAYTAEKSSYIPTAASPFNFPQTDLPEYEDTVDFTRPLAIPQVFADGAAPLLSAYPPGLLSYGIPDKTWYSFVDTVSAFLSADISKQALHHAADIATKMKEFHKAYASGVVRQAKHIGENAKSLNLFGVVGGALGLVFGTVGYAVGTVLQKPLTQAITSKPRTPRQRATVYVAAANQDWFHARGLHALLADTSELCAIAGTSIKEFREALRGDSGDEGGDAAQQLCSLRKWIAELEIKPLEPFKRQTPSQPAWTMTGRQNSGASSSKVKANETGAPRLHINASTLWLVVIQEKIAQKLLAETSAPRS